MKKAVGNGQWAVGARVRGGKPALSVNARNPSLLPIAYCQLPFSDV
jgi:hypothetical protein